MTKTLYMETTRKSPEETLGDIQKLLKTYNLTKFLADYQDGEVSGCVFGVQIGGKLLSFKMPVRYESILKMAKARKTKYIRDEIQAKRVAWRQIYRWIEAQLALVDTGMVAFEEVFLPYLADKNGTLYERMIGKGFNMALTSGEGE